MRTFFAGRMTGEAGPRRGVAYAVLAAVAVLVYANSLSNGLVCDDLQVIPGNPLVERPLDLVSIFTGPYVIGQQNMIGLAYRPLTVWSFAANFGLNGLAGRPGLDPFGFHLLNVLLHAVTVVLLCVLLLDLGLGLRGSVAAALLFAVHPIHTEAVAAVVNRSEVLAALFGILFLILHRRRAPALAAAALLFSAWGKESGVAFLPLAVLMDALFPHAEKPRPLRAWGAYLLVMAVWLGLWWSVIRRHPESQVTPFLDNPLVAASLAERLFTAARIHLHYLVLHFLPVRLSSDYSFNAFPLIRTPLDPWVFAAAVVAGVAAVAAWTMRRTAPVVAFALAGYPVLFAVTANVLTVIGCTAERHLYAPSIMWCALAGWIAGQPGRRREAALAIVIVAFAALTVARNRTWADELSLFRAQAASAPDSVRARYNFGTVLLKMGENRAAAEQLERALAIYPEHPDVSYNLGNALRLSGGDPERAVWAYRNAIRLDPANRAALSNLALYLTDLGRKREARPVVEALARLDPGYRSLPLLYRRLGLSR